MENEQRMFSEKTSDTERPTVSIGMPVYNDEKYVSKALDDLLAQSFTDFELIISDNSSTDRTEEICRRYAAKDRRVRYFRQDHNLGMQSNFVFVLHQACGEFFMWAASDDRWDKDFIRVLLDALRRDESYVSAFCPFIRIDEEEHPLHGWLSGTLVFDYSGRTALWRLAKFCFYYYDGFFYGLYRRELIKDIQLPVWWWLNAKSPKNCAHPVLAFFLARGGYVQAGVSPLWCKRIHVNSKPRYSVEFAGRRFVGFLAFLLRKFNVFYESARAVYRGRCSLLLTLVLIPLFAARFLADCIRGTFYRGYRLIGLVPQRSKR